MSRFRLNDEQSQNSSLIFSEGKKKKKKKRTEPNRLRTLLEQPRDLVTSQGCWEIARGVSGYGMVPSLKAAWATLYLSLSFL